MLYAGERVPLNWACCDGSLLPIAQNGALFSLIGVSYGGDGITTFALPDLRGRLPMGANLSGAPDRLVLMPGEAGGSSSFQLLEEQLPAHTHPLSYSSAAATSAEPKGNVQAVPQLSDGTASVLSYGPATSLVPGSADSIGPVGQGRAIEALPPFQTVNYLICTNGQYPEFAQ